MLFSHIAILTGAGISAESGIPVFRSEDGLWEQHKVEDVATYEGFMRDKTLVHNFYNKMRRELKERKPNAGHIAITHLQEEMEKQRTALGNDMDDLAKTFIQENYNNVLGTGVFLMLCNGFPYPVLTPIMEEIINDAPDSFKNNPMIKEYVSVARSNMDKLQAVQ